MKKIIMGKDKKTGKDKLQIFQPIDKRKIEEEKILKKYPKIFRQKDLPMTQTCMCWGLDIGLGWMPLIDCLCGEIQSHIDRDKKIPQVEALQVKEKFGGLRFYVSGGDEYTESIIDFAEELSYSICENCGTTEGVTQTEGWIVTLCKKCMGEEN